MLKDHSADETAAAASARGLDLQAYLNRIGVDRLPRNAGAALRQLHRAHVTSIPFENLDVVLGRKISVDVADLEAKLVRHRRGGYCYEHNLLFAAALEQLGYQVELLVGRVQPAKPGPRTHAVLRVEADARSWLADVGFGGPAQLLEPIPMTLTAPVAQDDWAYRIVDAPFDGGRVLQAAGSEGWVDQYAFTTEPHHATDYALYNYNASHNPSSPFVRGLVAQANRGAVRYRLVGTELQTIAPVSREPAQHRQLRVGEVPDVLHSWFHIHLGHEERRTLLTWLSTP